MVDRSEDEVSSDIDEKWWDSVPIEYDTIVKCQPMGVQESYLGSSYYPIGKPYRVYVGYSLKGYQLLIRTLRYGSKRKDFNNKLIDLTKCALMTEPVLASKPPLLLSTYERASYIGERFFFTSYSEDFPTGGVAFTLYFPRRNIFMYWKNAANLSFKLKQRIHEAIIKGKEADHTGERRNGA